MEIEQKKMRAFFSSVARTLIFPFCVSIGSYFFDFTRSAADAPSSDSP